jgi:hypothetical protein
MTDPQRISSRASGLAAELLRASADEQPNAEGMQRTLAALGVSGVVLTATSAASAAAAPVASTGKAVSAALLAKWIGVGLVGGVGLASAASVVTTPAVAPPTPVVETRSAPPRARAAPSVAAMPAPASVPAPSASSAARTLVTAAPTPPPDTEEDVAPLAAEVSFVDRARADLAAGKTAQALSALGDYERQFPDARLLPEVLFLQLETYERLGRTGEARRAAQRLVSGFPRSPHTARARELLNPQPHFP